MKRIRGLGIVLLACGLGGLGCSRARPPAAQPPPPEVLVTSPRSEDVTDFEEFIGHTEAISTVEVRARVTGYLDKVNFNDGDEIEKGELLFQIDDRPYKAEFDRTEATLEQGKARLARLTADQLRALALVNRGTIAREEFDRINGDFEEGKASIGVYNAAVDRSKLDLTFTQVTAPIGGRLSRRMVDPGNLVRADETPLTSIVSLDPMYVYFNIDERTILRIRRLIAEGKIKSRQEAEVPVDVGLSDEVDFPHRGTINFSDNKVNSNTGTLEVRGIITNPKPRLLSPGLFVRVRVPIGNTHKSITIDEKAISSEQSSKYVYVVRKKLVPDRDPKTKQPIVDPATGKPKETLKDVAFIQDIKVGSLSRGFRAVTEGLALDDRIIISGLQRVKAGEPVIPIVQKAEEKAEPSSTTASHTPAILPPPAEIKR